jgi:hypothetical protein
VSPLVPSPSHERPQGLAYHISKACETHKYAGSPRIRLSHLMASLPLLKYHHSSTSTHSSTLKANQWLRSTCRLTGGAARLLTLFAQPRSRQFGQRPTEDIFPSFGCRPSSRVRKVASHTAASVCIAAYQPCERRCRVWTCLIAANLSRGNCMKPQRSCSGKFW